MLIEQAHGHRAASLVNHLHDGAAGVSPPDKALCLPGIMCRLRDIEGAAISCLYPEVRGFTFIRGTLAKRIENPSGSSIAFVR